MASVEDIDISEFIKEYFGIRLLTYQKIILDMVYIVLRWRWIKNKILNNT